MLKMTVLSAPRFLRRYFLAALLLCGVLAVAVAGADAARPSRQQPVFKANRDSRPGDWGRFERTMVSLEGQVRSESFLTETRVNNGKEVIGMVVSTDPSTGKTQADVAAVDPAATVENTLLEDNPLAVSGNASYAAPGRETVVVAGHGFDCVVISATVAELSRDLVAEFKIWYSPQAPLLGLVKRETVVRLASKPSLSVATRVELTEWGDASSPPVYPD